MSPFATAILIAAMLSCWLCGMLIGVGLQRRRGCGPAPHVLIDLRPAQRALMDWDSVRVELARVAPLAARAARRQALDQLRRRPL